MTDTPVLPLTSERLRALVEQLKEALLYERNTSTDYIPIPDPLCWCAYNSGFNVGHDANCIKNKKLLASIEAALLAEAQQESLPPLRGLVIDRDADLRIELRAHLDTLTITGDNIGNIRRSLFMPWDCLWNGWVRDETAQRETSSPLEGKGEEER